mmetsp:Transcript_15944/g.43737  ORF Transcript_15944/g.43737 Transcript_15944/m.43737 type:complete len:348 (+) Transcript_15944:375-1418(+)
MAPASPAASVSVAAALAPAPRPLPRAAFGAAPASVFASCGWTGSDTARRRFTGVGMSAVAEPLGFVSAVAAAPASPEASFSVAASVFPAPRPLPRAAFGAALATGFASFCSASAVASTTSGSERLGSVFRGPLRLLVPFAFMACWASPTFPPSGSCPSEFPDRAERPLRFVSFGAWVAGVSPATSGASCATGSSFGGAPPEALRFFGGGVLETTGAPVADCTASASAPGAGGASTSAAAPAAGRTPTSSPSRDASAAAASVGDGASPPALDGALTSAAAPSAGGMAKSSTFFAASAAAASAGEGVSLPMLDGASSVAAPALALASGPAADKALPRAGPFLKCLFRGQ